MQELDAAPFGMVALETAVGQVATHLIQRGVIDWAKAFAKLSTHPARLLGIDAGTLREGAPADLVLIDPARRWTVDAPAMQTKAYNTPLHGRELTGQVVATLVGGQCLYRSSL